MSSGWMSLVPSVYFRKSVAIENKRLWAIQMGAYLAILGAVIYLLITSPVYKNTVTPQIRMNLWAGGKAVTAGNNTFCDAAARPRYNYWPSSGYWNFQDPTCMPRCESPQYTGGECIRYSELPAQQSSELFFPLSFIDHLRLSSGTCPSPYMLDNPGECRKSHLIRDVEGYSINLLLQYAVQLPDSVWHSVLGLPLLASSELLIVIVGPDQKEVKRFKGNKVISLTLQEALKAAGVSLDDPIPGRVSTFPNSGSGANSRPRPRVTGLDVVMQLDFSNEFEQFKYQGPVCRIRITATPAWMSRTVVSKTDSQGSVMTKTYNGVRFRTHTKANFAWFQLYKVVYQLTLLVAWMQIPFFIVFYFAVYCLGTLSDVYQGFLYEDVNLLTEFNGVSARMLDLSFSFSDIHDLEEDQNSVWGVSRSRVTKRVEMILENAKELDKHERDMFSEFFFSHTATRMPSGEDAILVEDFLKTATSNENLLFEDIIKIIDSDSQNSNFLERFFMDDSLRAFSKKEDQGMVAQQLAQQAKNRRRSDRDLPLETYDMVMNGLRRTRDLSTLRACNLAKSVSGQTVINEQMEKLVIALRALRQKINTAKEGKKQF